MMLDIAITAPLVATIGDETAWLRSRLPHMERSAPCNGVVLSKHNRWKNVWLTRRNSCAGKLTRSHPGLIGKPF
jgi:hypothetical protein